LFTEQFQKQRAEGHGGNSRRSRLLNSLTNAAKATVNCEIISPDGKSDREEIFGNRQKFERRIAAGT
jgi:hypothetical protein